VSYSQIFTAPVFTLDGGSIVLPSSPAAGEIVTVMAPFTLSGWLSLFATPLDRVSGEPFYRTQLSGSGTVSVDLQAKQLSPTLMLFDVQKVSYNFGPSSAPVPEPGTLLLFGSGLGSVVLSRFRKRSH
jgi:hypothetical protein